MLPHIIDLIFLRYNDIFAIAMKLIVVDIGLDLAVETGGQRSVMVIAKYLQKGPVELLACSRLFQRLDSLLALRAKLRRDVHTVPVAQKFLRFGNFLTLHPVGRTRH